MQKHSQCNSQLWNEGCWYPTSQMLLNIKIKSICRFWSCFDFECIKSFYYMQVCWQYQVTFVYLNPWLWVMCGEWETTEREKERSLTWLPPDKAWNATNHQMIHVVLVRPLIPWNTGAIGRTCLCFGARLVSLLQFQKKRLQQFEKNQFFFYGCSIWLVHLDLVLMTANSNVQV